MAAYYLYWLDHYFINERFQHQALLLRKARLLTYIHIIGLVVSLLSFTILPIDNFPWLISLAAGVTMLIVFKKIGNLSLSANLFCAAAFGILVLNSTEKDILHSEGYHWMMVTPLIAALFCNGAWVFIWNIVFVLFGYFLYQNQLAIGQISGTYLPPEHYYISYSLLAGAISLIAYLYKRGENSMFASMESYQLSLEQQQIELTYKTAELKRTGEQLSRTNRELQNFAYSAGHDLKEPLRMISAYAQLLKRKMATHFTPDTNEFMEYITTGALRMQRLLDDLLKFSGIGNGKDNPIMVDLDDVVFYVRSNLKLAIQESNATIKTPIHLPHVFARYSEMVQLFQNLIANAIKFRKGDTGLDIHVDCKEINGFYQISIQDNGIGIPKEFQSKIFVPFEKYHSRNDFEGSGLGLAICQKIVELTGGKIWFESEEGQGTTFFFTLPLAQSEAQAKNNQATVQTA